MILSTTKRVHRSISLVATCAALSLTAIGSARAQDDASAPMARGAAAIAEIQARVVGIDPVTNSVSLQGPQGRVAEVAVNPEIGDVKKLQLGDIVNIQYRSALLVRATKVKSDGIRQRIDTEAAIPASGGVMAQARVVEVIGTIERVDAKKRRVTLRGPSRTVTLDVAPDVSLAGLKAGDTVQAQFESATAVQVLRSGQAVK
ncbi:copper-binding protein [Caballeronia sp. NK8]|jgi:Cu/Ag efflux protein CusF|uniref:copper-binding protein n=1 Tax=Caballeronia sp. NK8 TaxID=140098 RepID=UPI001BB64C32|nr:copper-binding protein [Caballeronia sp. NK8]BCQ25273.1 copper-binding protein [Caballeronia sp. NK8]